MTLPLGVLCRPLFQRANRCFNAAIVSRAGRGREQSKHAGLLQEGFGVVGTERGAVGGVPPAGIEVICIGGRGACGSKRPAHLLAGGVPPSELPVYVLAGGEPILITNRRSAPARGDC